MMLQKLKQRCANCFVIRALYFSANRYLSVSRNTLIVFFMRRLIQYRIRRRTAKPPQIVHIENTNICNAQCAMCANPTMRRAKGIMSHDDYEKIIAMIKELGTPTINLNGIGEPLCDKEFVRKICCAKAAGLRVVAVTNGALLDRQLSGAIIDAGLDELCFSVDAFSRERYGEIRVPLDRDRVYAAIEEFIALKEQKKSSMKIIVRAIGIFRNGGDKKDIRAFKKYWQQFPVIVQVTNLHTWNRTVSIDGAEQSVHGNDSLAMYPCDYFWQELFVTHELDVLPCCHDHEATLVLGNLRAMSLRACWFDNPILEQERMHHLTDRANKAAVCKTCDITPTWLIKR